MNDRLCNVLVVWNKQCWIVVTVSNKKNHYLKKIKIITTVRFFAYNRNVVDFGPFKYFQSFNNQNQTKSNESLSCIKNVNVRYFLNVY